MTDEFGVPEHQDDLIPATPEPSQPDKHDAPSILEGAGDFTSGEGLVAFAGIVLLAVWLIFEVIVDDYGISSLYLLIAVAVVMVPRIDPGTVAKLMPVNVIMKVLGYALAVGGVFVIIGDIETNSLDGAGTVIAALITYAAFVMAFLGARQIEI